MEHFVTLFDSLFLPQGLALHASLQRHAAPYRLWVLCMDEDAYGVLQQLALPNVSPIALADAENDDLRRAKAGRTRGEYCWTMTPFTPALVFERDPAAERVTYLDADTWFCRSPGEILSELDRSAKAVLITEHGYANEYDQSATSGRFCVQFVTFVRARGEPVRRWWAERCIEWCFARVEPGRFGDQKYLDDWPYRFPEFVHVLQKQSLVQAPWCGSRFAPGEAAFFHFHGLRLLRGRTLLLTEDYRIAASTRKAIYDPYLADLRAAVEQLQTVGLPPRPQIDVPVPLLRARLVARRLRRIIARRPSPRLLNLGI